MTEPDGRKPRPSRRSVLRTALVSGAAFAAPLPPALPKAGAARSRTGSLGDQSAVRTLTMGDVRLTYVVDAAMELDRAGFLPAVPDSYWKDHPEALAPSGRIAASAGGVLVERGGRRLLIDVGLGANVLSPSLGVSRGGALLRTLRALGVPAESIDTVAFTHLHTDHTGLGFLTGSGRPPRKAFPCADYLVAGAEWGPFWNREVEVGAPSWDGFMVPMSRVLRRFDDGDEVWPGVTALITPGHSPGHTTYVISAHDGRRILVFGDAFHTPAQVAHPEWPSGPDVNVDGVLKARAALLAQLRERRTYGFAFHFGDQAFGRVAAGDRWHPLPAHALLPTPVRLP
ncbi:MBL fold metallo-hydrolase [Streptomyces sp. PanSC9]|uniref:MBL fold metallo-hydrolase n=1 Tax=Streptomyces sp. PanSC9 TaxID=1520461 RepID=UPI000F47F485|nr:MBL fold metallo-hydrolase [Streptomyces sp. PanSC9]ROP55771.1 glyoxylase-like metal-dependent hydrolase (beta-lactamase superfamily II) [Streptomyces sp. PanSC9]